MLTVMQTFFTSWLAGIRPSPDHCLPGSIPRPGRLRLPSIVSGLPLLPLPQPPPRAARAMVTLPKVTVQLPLFNEMYVAQRLLESVSRIRYPRDRFEIQVLDDSTDETQEICKRKVAELLPRVTTSSTCTVPTAPASRPARWSTASRAPRVSSCWSSTPTFIPEPDVLERTIHFFSDPKVAMVQVRWDHLNRDYSTLTEVQAMMLDGHFVIEHTARHRSGRFFNFNGTAVACGGKSADYRRRRLAARHPDRGHGICRIAPSSSGWQFIYLPDVVSPAELPVEMNSFKSPAVSAGPRARFRWPRSSCRRSCARTCRGR